MINNEFEIAIIGAGMAGITCANELQRVGKSVIILEKSRGVGGRMATRRLFETIADHGTCYLSPKDPRFQAVFDRLISAGIVTAWTNTVHILDLEGKLSPDLDFSPRYIASAGMSSIAKFLASGLDIRLSQKVIRLEPTDNGWRIAIEGEPPTEIFAKTVISTIPAPQAVDLLGSIEHTLPPDLVAQLRSIEFYPSIAVMAGYTPFQLADWYAHYPAVCAVSCPEDPHLGWLGVDSSKRPPDAPPVFVLQSTAKFAEHYATPDYAQLATTALLNQAGERFRSWLAHPQWRQTQVWRYAFAKNPLTVPYLQIEQPAPLILTGDWCGGRKVESAMLAGLAVAELFQLENLGTI
jgi:renalase